DLCCRIDPMGVMLFGSLGLAVTGFLVFAAISSASQNLLLISTLVLGLAYGTMVGLTGSHMYIFVADLFPTSLRALGFGLSFNLAFAILG
ncbi:proP, partial [Symbiodinium necroappetens]